MARTVAADYGQKADLIVAAAARVFAEAGYERATIGEIARVAGFSKASLYHYFPSKEAVLHALLIAALNDLATAVAIADPGPAAPPRERLRALIRAYATAYIERVSVVTPLLLDLGRLRPAWRAEVVQRERTLLDLFTDATTAAGCPSPRVAAFAIFGAANWTYHWYDPARAHPPDTIADHLAALLVDGVGESGVRSAESEVGGLHLDDSALRTPHSALRTPE